ncbi:MAG: VCBS repeat-containing protein [Verrucomicrobia bacterium]|nr:VCBS repeat-containing protein [Verrucomicrobiota bacterium]
MKKQFIDHETCLCPRVQSRGGSRLLAAALLLGMAVGTALVVATASAATPRALDGVIASQWRAEDGSLPPVHAAPVWQGKLQISAVPLKEGVQTGGRAKSGGGAGGRVVVVVADGIYSDVSTKLTRYVQDIEAEGFSVITYRFVSGSAADLRAYLQGLYGEAQSLAGAVFVGNLPYIIFEKMSGDGGDASYSDWPCDLFFMDMNGTWSDTLEDREVHAGNGKYDTWDFSRLEIWVCRLKTDNLGALGSETAILNNYFDKSHSYRQHSLTSDHTALAYPDDDWDWVDDTKELAMAYGSAACTLVNDDETTTATDYKTVRLPTRYDYIHVRSHGTPNGHEFFRSGGTVAEWVRTPDYRTIDPPALFYTLFICSAADYTATNYLAGTIAFNEMSGLLTVGSTKAGGMIGGSYWYGALGRRQCFGGAFVEWYNAEESVNAPGDMFGWHGGMVLIGDATLRPSPQTFGFEVSVPRSAQEGDGVLANAGRVSIYYAQASDTVVTLTSTDTTELTVPASVTIPAGQTSAVFNVTIINDGVSDPAQVATVRASATGWSTGEGQTLVTDPTYTGPGQGLVFDGVDDYVEVPHDGAFKPTNALTLSVWVYRSNWTVDANQTILGCTQTGGYALALQNGSPDVVRGYVRLNGAYLEPNYTTAGLAAGWHHLALTCDGRYARLYIDGQLRNTKDAGASYPLEYNAANSLILGAEASSGAEPAGDYFAGRLDEVRIWNVARSEDEIRDAMHRELDGTETSLAAYYPLCGGGVTLFDRSTNAHDGTLQNGPAWATSGAPCSQALADATNVRAAWPARTNSLASGRLSVADGAVSGEDYVVFGHDNANEIQNATDKPADVQWRLNRVWQVDQSGSLTVDLSFDVSGWSGDFALLVDADGVFANATVITGGRAGDTFTATGVGLQDGWFYTVAQVVAPTVTTAPIADIAPTTATAGGEVTVEGSFPVTARGVCWNTAGTPTVGDSHTTDGLGLGTFTSALTSLTPGRTYHVRAYATSALGTAYGEERVFTTTMTPPGNALTLDGSNDYVEIADAAALDLTANYTLECWFKADGFGGLRGLISKYQSSGANGYLLRLTGTDLDFDGRTTTGLNLQAGRWYYVAAVKSGGTRTLYVNGVAQTLSSSTFTVVANTNPLRLGSDYSGRFFDGQLDEVRVWNVARSQDEIRDAMHRELQGTETGLVAYFNCNQSAGATLFDQTTNDLDGTLVNGAAWAASTVPGTSQIASRTNLRAAWIARTASLASGRMSVTDSDIAGSDFVVFGHDNADETQNATDKPAGVQWRLNRVWQLDESSALMADVSFDVSGWSGDFALLADADGTFANATLVAGTRSGDTFTAPGVNLQDGFFYTVASVVLPTVSTAPVTGIAATTATSGGNVTSEGGASVTARGCVWNTTGSPTLAGFDGATTNGSGTGEFSSSLTGLTSGQTYYVRAYATSPLGTGYGTEVEFLTTITAPGKALAFDGANDYVNIGHGAGLDLGNTLTIEAWVKPTALSSRRAIFSTRLNNDAGSFQLEVGPGNGGANRVAVSGVGTWAAETVDDALASNVWTHVAYTRTGTGAGTHTLYVNGTARTLATDANYTFVNNSSDKVIGSGTSGGQLFLGQVDELRVWSAARSGDEIRDAMHKELSGSEPNLVAYHKFNHVSGTTAADATGHGHDGTLVNGPVWLASTIPCTDTLGGRTNLRAVWKAATTSLASGRLSLADGDVGTSDFAVFGHDAAAETQNSSDVPSGVLWRLNRAWQLDESGALTADLRFDVSGWANAFVLLTDADGTFANATVIYGERTGDTFTAPGVSLEDGVFYTVAAVDAPTVTTAPVTAVTVSGATCGGDVTSQGGAAVSARGVCWNTNGNPTLLDSHTTDGSGTGSFVSTVSGLSPGVTYHVRAYAANALAPNYGEERVFTTPNVFTNIQATLEAQSKSAGVWGDLDNDGDLDLLHDGISGTTSRTMRSRNNGNGTFSESQWVASFHEGAIALGDFDNDGALDVLINGWYSVTDARVTKLYRNNGSGSFSDTGVSFPGVRASSAAWGDYNNDGHPDLLLTGDTGSVLITRLYRNNGDGTFTEIGAGLPGVYFGSGTWADFDRDGDLDILLCGWSGASPISRVYRNDGNGVFTDLNAGLAGVWRGEAHWGDYDNDGYPDILLSGSSTSRIYHNNHNGTFTDIGAGLTGLDYAGVAWGDYDNDGDLDVLLMGDSGSSLTRLYRNDGNNTFTLISNTGLGNVGAGDVIWGDYDQDGKLDLFQTGTSGGVRSDLYRNQIVAANTPPTAPAGLQAVVNANTVTLSWNAASDTETSAAGLTYELRIGTTSGSGDIVSAPATSAGWRRVACSGSVGANISWTLTNLPLHTVYYWSVQAVDTAFAGSAWATEGSFTTPYPPGVTTAPVSGITATTAQCGGSVTNQGASAVTARGCVWNTTGNPTVASHDGMTSDGSGLGDFTSGLTGLTEGGQVYYVRAYASNGDGTTYGEERSFATSMTPPGNALALDGVNDYVNVGRGTGFDVGNTLTIEAWVKPTSLSGRCAVFSTRLNSSSGSFQLEVGTGNGGVNRVAVTGSSTWVAETGDNVFGANQWTHIAYTRTATGAGTHTLYVNGVAQALVSDANYTFVNNTSDKLIGAGDNGGHLFPGQIDELRVWSVARTQSEIQDAMHQQLNGGESGLVAYYRFNHLGGSTLWDVTGHGHDGTLVNGPAWAASTIPCANIIADRTNLRGVWSARVNSLASSRLSVSNSSAADTNSAVVGHDNGTDDWGTSDLPNGIGARLGRVWRAELTSAQTADVRFDTAGLTFADASNLRLLVDADGVFAEGATAVAGSFGGNTFTVASQSLQHLRYYTLALISTLDIAVRGNGQLIADGDTTPSPDDFTQFSTKFVGSTTSTRTFVIANDGTSALTVSDITAGGDFSIEGLSLPASVPANGSANFTVRFSPSAAGTRTATVTISNDDPDAEGTYTFAIQGEGLVLATPTDRPYAMNIAVAQNDTNDTSASVTLSASQTYRDLRLNSTASDRGDYAVQIDDTSSDDSANGILIASVREISRNNSEGAPLNGTRYATATAYANGANGYVAGVQDSPNGAEYNQNLAVAYFPFAESWICGHATNSADDGPITGLNTSPGIDLGEEFVDNGNGTYTLRIPGVSSQTDGVLLVSGGKDEDNYALSKANTDGSWTIYCHDNGTNAAVYERDPVAFAYVPTGASAIVGMFDAEGDAVLGSGFSVTRTASGTFTLSIRGYMPADGVFLVSPAGGDSLNMDNIVTCQATSTNWIIQTRDLTDGVSTPILQDVATNQPVCSFAFFASPMTPPGKSLAFNGTNAHANVGHGASLDVGNTLTVEAWIKPANLTNRYGIFSTRFPTNIGGGFQLEVGTGSGGTSRLVVSGRNTYVAQTGDNVVASNQWSHVAYTRTGTGSSTHTLYVNGVAQVLISDADYTFTNNTSDKVIGAGTSGGQFFPGQIDEVRVWNTARTQDQIRDAMHKTLSGDETGLVAYYRFDHASGATLADLTTNANNGTLTNMTDADWVASTFPCADAIAGRSNLRGAWSAQTNSLSSSLLTASNAVVSGTDFRVFGHDNGTLAQNTSDKPARLVWRLNRAWRTEGAGTLTGDLAFDCTGIAGLITDPSKLRLLTDADGVFTNASVATGSYAGATFIVASQSLASGNYYTLGQERGNSPPSAQTLTVCRKPGVPVKIRLSNLATNWSDPDSDPVEFVSAAVASTNSVPVSADGTFILYDAGNSSSQNVTDRFAYTIRDQPPEGLTALTALGTVIIQVDRGTNMSCNIVASGLAGDGNSQLTFAGIPGQTYLVQRATSLTSPVVWTSLTNNVDGSVNFVAGPNGQWTHTDLNSASYPQRYYRTAIP